MILWVPVSFKIKWYVHLFTDLTLKPWDDWETLKRWQLPNKSVNLFARTSEQRQSCSDLQRSLTFADFCLVWLIRGDANMIQRWFYFIRLFFFLVESSVGCFHFSNVIWLAQGCPAFIVVTHWGRLPADYQWAPREGKRVGRHFHLRGILANSRGGSMWSWILAKRYENVAHNPFWKHFHLL